MSAYVSVLLHLVLKGGIPAISRCEDKIFPFGMFADQE
jgi:hypothetical protein